MQQTGAVSCAADRRVELLKFEKAAEGNQQLDRCEPQERRGASPDHSASSKVHSGFACHGRCGGRFAGAKLGDAELAGQCVAAASLADIGRAGSSDARDWRLARKQGAKAAVAKAVAARNAAGYAPASLEVFEMYQRMLPEDERLQGRTTRGRRLWTQRFCKQWKFVRRRIGLRQVELTLAQKRAKAPCLQVFFLVFLLCLCTCMS